MAAVIIRRAEASDHNYLVDNFARSYQHSGYASGTSTAVLRRLFEPLLAVWTCDIVAPAFDRKFIIAWMLYRDPNAIAWLHVRPGRRREGFARMLLQAADVCPGTVEVPFMPTKLEGYDGSFTALAREHGYQFRFRPYMPLGLELDIERAVAS